MKNGTVTPRVYGSEPNRARTGLGWPSEVQGEMKTVREYQSRWHRTVAWWRFRRAVNTGRRSSWPMMWTPSPPLMVFKGPWSSVDMVRWAATVALLSVAVLALVLTAAVIVEVFA